MEEGNPGPLFSAHARVGRAASEIAGISIHELLNWHIATSSEY